MPSDPGHRTATVSQEDEEILASVRALQAGAGSHAFEPIFRRFLPPLLRFFSKRDFPAAVAEELAQTTLAKAYQSIGQYRFEAGFSSWLLRIAENVWKNA